MNKLFSAGDTIYGFCNGYFGRDDYDTKVCILVNSKYAVFQYISGEMEGYATVLNGHNKALKKEYVDKWKIQDEEDY